MSPRIDPHLILTWIDASARHGEALRSVRLAMERSEATDQALQRAEEALRLAVGEPSAIAASLADAKILFTAREGQQDVVRHRLTLDGSPVERGL